MDYLQYITNEFNYEIIKTKVLNLIINGLPSILLGYEDEMEDTKIVLNLIINGLPSIL